MRNKYVFTAILLGAILVISMAFTNLYVTYQQPEKEEDFVVVTSFYPMYIAAMNVIGDIEGVALKNLSEPQTGCLHDFQLTPADMKLLSTADVFIINGGGIEAFMEEIAVQYPDLKVIEACEGLELLEEAHAHEDEEEEAHEQEEAHNHEVNAHAWMSVALYREQIANIAGALSDADKAHQAAYAENAGNYDKKLEELQAECESLSTSLAGKSVILFHSAYAYVAKELGLDAVFCMDLDEERQVSAGEVAQVITAIEEAQAGYIFAEELYAASMCEMVQREAEVEVLYLDSLNRGAYEADSYLQGMKQNLRWIREKLLSGA